MRYILVVMMFFLSSQVFALDSTKSPVCDFKGSKYADGAATKIDDCNWCSCRDGKMTCTQMTCSKKPKKRKMKNCYVPHPSCYLRNSHQGGCLEIARYVKHGQKVPAEDGCSNCVCNDGKVECKRTAKCEQMSSCEYVWKDGNGKKVVQTIKHGVKFKPNDDCNRCVCHKGKVICTKYQCLPSCLTHYTVKNGKPVKQRYKHGDAFEVGQCKLCFCAMGKVTCLQKAACKHNTLKAIKRFKKEINELGKSKKEVPFPFPRK